jgi:2-dehydro-3-deoxyphosphogluconate aldolase / (4S)-4-hydroxy-2-oxoglutarate aldolase
MVDSASPSFEVAHVGVNCGTPAAAIGLAEGLFRAFGLASRIGNSSVFVGREIELMKGPARGAMGHIALATASIEDALVALEARGIRSLPETEKRGEDGRLSVVYLDFEAGGFAVHLVRK